MYILSKEIFFPNPRKANEDGILAIGGDLSPKRLMLAYQQGIFPWFHKDDPIVWWSPKARMVLFPEELKVSKSMKQVFRKKTFQVTFNTDFKHVIENCATVRTNNGEETWITKEMEEAYCKLHELGHAKSVEVWNDEKQLVGGLYGVDLPKQKIFCGESMFSKESNASKVAFITWVKKLASLDYKLVDCQLYTSHLESLGAREIDREDFLTYL